MKKEVIELKRVGKRDSNFKMQIANYHLYIVVLIINEKEEPVRCVQR